MLARTTTAMGARTAFRGVTNAACEATASAAAASTNAVSTSRSVPLQQRRWASPKAHTNFLVSSTRPSVLAELTTFQNSFHHMVMDDCERFPADKPAFKCALSNAQVTYGDIPALTYKYAAVLYHKFGVRKGDVVVLLCPNTPRYICLFHSVLALGAIVSPVSSMATPAEILRQAKLANASVILANSSMPQIQTDAIKSGLKVCTDAAMLNGTPPVPEADLAPECAEADDTIVLPFSSGTTGLPKGVQLTNCNLVANVLQTQVATKFTDTDILLSVLPYFHIYGLTVMMHGVLHAGGTQITFPQFDMVKYLETLEAERATLAFVAPPIVVGFIKHPKTKSTDTRSIRLVLSGAAPLGEEVQRLAEPLFKQAFIGQGYGLTETSPVISVTPLEYGHYGEAGALVSDVDARIVRQQGDHFVDVPIGEEGELWVRGPNVMKGYLEAADTHVMMPPSEGGEWLRTGDLGLFDTDLNLRITDRLKELIKYNGCQVAPAEVEAALQQHPDVLEAIVVGVPTDDGSGEVPRAHVVVKEGVEKNKAFESAIHAHVADVLGPMKKLRGGIKFVSQIPKTPSGKLLRRVVRDEVRAEKIVAPSHRGHDGHKQPKH